MICIVEKTDKKKNPKHINWHFMVSKFFIFFFLLAKKVGSPELAIQQVPLKTPPKYRKQTPLEI